MTSPTSAPPATTSGAVRPRRRPPLRRVREGRWVAGVTTGAAAHLRLPVWGVRTVVVGLVAAGGAGLVGYLLLWALLPLEGEDGASAGPAPAGSPGVVDPLARWAPSGSAVAQLVVGAAMLAAGAQLLLARAGVQTGGVLVAAAVALAGAVVAWSHLAPQTRVALLVRAGGGTADGLRRVVLGAGLVVAGSVLLGLGGAQSQALGPAAVAGLAVLGGVALVVAPWGTGLLRELQAERAGRLREAERAEVAAHLHDSVLQTLALLQRHADDPSAVARLARRQERELRAWLHGGRPGAGAAGESLAARVRSEAAAVEDDAGVPVEVVVVGDRPLDPAGDALAQALREAVLNAVRHGRPPVQVYLEAGPAGAEAFVRDHGDGVDLAAVPADRLGLRESVLGRMARAGGSASVRPAPGGGTEVALSTAPAQPTGTTGPAGTTGSAG